MADNVKKEKSGGNHTHSERQLEPKCNYWSNITEYENDVKAATMKTKVSVWRNVKERVREHTCGWIKIYKPNDQHANTENHLWKRRCTNDACNDAEGRHDGEK